MRIASLRAVAAAPFGRRSPPFISYALPKIAWVLGIALAGLTAACGTDGAPDRFDLADASVDGVADASTDLAEEVIGDGAEEVEFADANPNLGAPCVDDTECANSAIACATFTCDPTVQRCLAHPDDSKCDDGLYCDGVESCDPLRGCVDGAVVDCGDGEDSCMINVCDEATKSCTHAPRDEDGDGDPTLECAPLGHDCNDHDPTVSSLVSEVCGNGIDDNCNGLIDETPCVSPAYSTCDDALVVTTDGTYAVALAGTTRTIAASCADATFVRQVVVALTVPAGATQDVDVTATITDEGSAARVSLASDGECGDATTETGCVVSPEGAQTTRLRLHSLAPGPHALLVTSTGESHIELTVAFDAATTAPTNIDCGSALDALDATTTSFSGLAELTGPLAILSSCTNGAGPLVYSVTVSPAAAPADLHVTATPLLDGVRAIVGLRNADCAGVLDEITCGSGAPAALFARSLVAGTYYFTVGSTSPSDVEVLASLTAAVPAPAVDSCATAPALPVQTTTIIDLTQDAHSMLATCLPALAGGPPTSSAAAYDLALSVPSDVLVIAHGSADATLGLGIDGPGCATAGTCSTPTYPQRVSERGVAAGDYRVVVESAPTSSVSLSAFVRPTAPIGPIGAAGCTATPVVIPASGGFFVGNTTGGVSSFDESCDSGAAGVVPAPDVIYELTITTKSRLILDAIGSTLTTILSVRQGVVCPGIELSSGCTAGYISGNAFLDLELDVGTYWIIVDGYSGGAGAYQLDVRVAPPEPALP